MSSERPGSERLSGERPGSERVTAKRPHRRRGPVLASAGIYAVLIVGAVLTVSPFLLSVMTSLKTPGQVLSGQPLDLPAPVTLENYVSLFTENGFGHAMLITAGVVVVTTIGQLTTSIFAAFAFARLRFPGRDVLFWLYLSTMMIPAAVTFIPLFLMMSQAGLKNTFLGITLPFALVSPYAVFLLRQFFLGIPQDVIDAASLDGASTWRILWRIMVPMARPIIVTLTLITVVSHWNNFLWPLMIAPANGTRTLTVATSALQTAHDGQWWLVMAATTVATVPLLVLFLIFQKQIVRSIAVTSFR